LAISDSLVVLLPELLLQRHCRKDGIPLYSLSSILVVRPRRSFQHRATKAPPRPLLAPPSRTLSCSR
uniref:Ovule protein n=1 Tax=Haemonchus placei TaxID=6290 RepID=A0A0N4WG55_HAEPC